MYSDGICSALQAAAANGKTFAMPHLEQVHKDKLTVVASCGPLCVVYSDVRYKQLPPTARHITFHTQSRHKVLKKAQGAENV